LSFVGTKWKGQILHSTDVFEWNEILLRTPEHVTGVFYPRVG